jgi:hypothetical protein
MACAACLCSHGLALAATTGAGPATAEQAELGALIEAMKENPRGPFSRIRWFCEDGEVLPPKPYACAEHGGGRQHGEWSDDTRRVRAAGYPIANVLAALGVEDFGETPEAQRQFRFLVLEQFLIDADDGWILRQARYYRGAFQVEDEEASAYEFLSRLARQPAWQTHRYPLLVEAVRLVPHGGDGVSHAEVRGMATALNEKDPGFGELRNKIHGRPDPADAARVRDYARTAGKPELQDDYAALAAAIDALSKRPDPDPMLEAYASKVRDAALASDVRRGAAALRSASDPATQLEALAGLMGTLREGLPTSGHPLDTIDLILDLESRVFQLGQTLPIEENGYTRQETLRLMRGFALAAYGSGLLTRWERDNLGEAFSRMSTDSVTLDVYRDELRYLGRVPGWGARRLALYFEPEIEDFARIEPFVREYIPDRMRGSPLLFYSRLLNPLAADAMVLAGVRQEMFGQQVATGLRSLNPGLGSGVLRTLEQLQAAPEGTADSIALVAETVSELPVVAGILTEHEGNSLSHVQLLARNLGVPNVVVGDELLGELRQYLGRRIRIASSPGGVVRIELDEGGQETATPTITQERISVDVGKLDLQTQRLIPTSELSSADQGVRVGPKAAQVGKLTQQFPGHVAPGLAVPFGLFAHALLEREVEPGGPTLFDWMSARFDELQAIDDPVERTARTREVLATIRGWFETRPPNPGKLKEFLDAVERQFGPDGSFGVFVRSDTNVEDLPGFTGAGINLTVPNVVGFDNLIAAMRQVWASPFTERSFGWRQGIMADPEHVYASVLLHKSVNVDKSGVMVTADADTGSLDHITVVLNEGVGGGVEGQAAETLLIRRADGAARLLGSATAPRKRVLLETGGSALVASSGSERLLTPANIRELLAVVERLPGWFDHVPEEERATTVADVEFGFLGDKLYLFQIRPFVQNKGAASNRYLQSLDAGLREATSVRVDLDARPGGRP